MNYKPFSIKFFPAILIVLLVLAAFAVTPAQALDCTSLGSGDWDAITWSCGQTPTASDSVSIDEGHTVTLTGDITVINLAIDINAELITSGYNVTITGNFENSGTFTPGASNIILSGTGDQNIDGFTTTGTLSMTKTGGTATLMEDVEAGNLTINGSGGTLNLGSGLTHTISGTWTRTAGTLNGGSSTLVLTGATPVTGATGTFTANAGTVEYAAAGAQNVAGLTYYDLTISGSGEKNPAGLEVTNNLTIESGNTLNIGAVTVVIANTVIDSGGTLKISSTSGTKTFGNVTNNGIWEETEPEPITFTGSLTNNSITFTASTGIHLFTGTGETIGGSSEIVIPTVEISGTYTNTGTLTVSSTLTRKTTAPTAEGTLIQGTGSVLNIGGTIYTSATAPLLTLDAGTNVNTVNYTGAAQNVKAATYHHLTLSGSGGKTLPAGLTNINGNFIIQGSASTSTAASLTIGGDLTLNSTATTPLAVGAHSITVTGTTTITDGKLNHTSATGTKTYNGDVLIESDGTWDDNDVNNIAIDFGGSFTNNGSITAGTGVHTFTGSGKSFNGTVSIQNVAITGSYTNNAALTISTALTGSGSLTQGSSGTLNIAATDVNFTIGTLDASAVGNTVNYNGTAQTVKPIIYHNLTLGNSGAKTTTGVTVNGTLTMEGAATASVTPTYDTNAAIVYNKGATTGTVGPEWPAIFNGTGGVTIGGTGMITLNESKAVGGSLTINGKLQTATSATAVNNDLAIGGNLTNNGTFTVHDATIGVAGNFDNNATVTTAYDATHLTSPSITVGGNFENDGGTFTATALTLTIGGNFTNGSGTFTANGTGTSISTIKLSGDYTDSGGLTSGTFHFIMEGTNVAQNIAGFTTTGTVSMTKTAGTATFTGPVNGGALTINGAGGTLNLGVSLAHKFTGTWTRTAGTLDGGSSTLQLTAATPVSGSGGTFTAGTGTVNYSGNVAQAVAGLTYYDLQITRANTTSYTKTLGGNLTAQTLTVGTGITFDIGSPNVTINGATTVTGTLKHSVNAGAKIYKGLVTVTGTWNNSGNVPMNFQGGLTNNGTFTAGSGIYTFDTNPQSIGGSKATTIPNVTVNGVTLTNTNSATNVSPNGLSITTALSGNGTLEQAAGAILNIGGTSAISTLNASASGNTVNYNKAGAQTVIPVTYHHLTLSGSGNKTLTGVSTINGNLTMSGASTTAASEAALNIGGNLVISSGTFTVGAYDITVEGITTVNGTLTHAFHAGGTKLYKGKVTIGGAAGKWIGGDNNFTFRGGLENNSTAAGPFTSGIGIYTFNTNAQNISGTKAIAIYSLNIDGITLTNINSAGLTLTSGGNVSTINGGSLTQGSGGVLNVGLANLSSVTLDASFNPNTVNYNLAGAQTVKPITYHNLTLSGSGAKNISGLSNVNGNLVVSGTAIAILQGNLTVGGAVSINASSGTGKLDTSTHTLYVGGNWSKKTGTFASTGTVVFNGSGNQTITGGTGFTATTFKNLTIDKPSGYVSVAISPTINGAFTLTQGVVFTTTNFVIIGKTGTVAGGDADSFVVGNVRKFFNTGVQSFKFPLGYATTSDPTLAAVGAGYRPMTISNLNVTSPAAGTGFLTATVPATPTEHAQLAGSNIQASKNVNRYWTLTPGGSLVTSGVYGATFEFETDQHDAGANPLIFTAKRYQVSNTTWTAPTVGTRTSNSIVTTSFAAGFGTSATHYVVGELQSTNMSAVTLSPALGTYEYGTSVTSMSATLKQADGITPLQNQAVIFEFEGRQVGTAVMTNSSGVATLSTNAFILANVGTGKTLTARYAGDNITFGPSTADSASFEVTQRAITLTAVTSTKTYDATTSSQATPTVTGTLASGDVAIQTFDNKDAGSNKELIPTVDDGNGGANYNITVANPGNTLGTINPKALTITGVTADNKTYDGNTDATLSGTPVLNGVESGDTVNFTSGAITTGTFNNKHAGNGKTVTASSAYTIDDANYTVTQPTFTANIGKAAVTLTAVADIKVYDGTTSSDETPGVTGTLYDTDTAIQTFDTKDVGAGKDMVPSVNDGNNGNNYDITIANADNDLGEITQATITVTPNDVRGFFHPNNTPYPLNLTFTAVGFGTGESFASPGFTAPTCIITNEFTRGNYPTDITYPNEITCSGGAVSANYSLTLDNNDPGDLTVETKILLTVTADDQAITYGDAIPALTFQYSGFEDADGDTFTDDASDIETPPACSTTPTASQYSDAGAYVISCSGGVDTEGYYELIYVNGTLTVNQAPLTVTANPQTIAATRPLAYTFAYSGFVGGDDASVLDTAPVCAPGGAPYIVGVNTGKIVCSGGVDTNYSFNYVNGNLTIVAQTYNITSTKTQDGWILESGEITKRGGTMNSTQATFLIGDDAARKQYIGVLSFNTAPLPDSIVVTKVLLKLRYAGVVGNLNATQMMTAFQGITVDMRKGTFGTASLATSDFQATGFKSFTSKPSLASNFYTINLTKLKANINNLATNSGLTQMKVHYKLDDNNNSTANQIKLFSGNVATASYRPKLTVTYYLLP